MFSQPLRNPPEPGLVLDGLVVGYPQKPCSTTIDLTLGPGTCILRGSNGCGKSTLLRTIAGVLPPHAGRVLVNGFDVQREHRKAHRHLAYAPDHLPLPATALAGEFLQLIRWAHGLGEDLGHSPLAEQFDIMPSLMKPLHSLSLGQQRRLLLVSALALRSPITLLDEPTVGLDPGGIALLHDHLRERTTAGLITLVVTHEAWADTLPDCRRLMWASPAQGIPGGPVTDPASTAPATAAFPRCDRR